METLGAAIGKERADWPHKLARIVSEGGWNRQPEPARPSLLPLADELRALVERADSGQQLDESERASVKSWRAWQHDVAKVRGENHVRLRTLMGALAQERARLEALEARTIEDQRTAAVLYKHMRDHWGVPDVPADDHDADLAAEIALAIPSRRAELAREREVARERRAAFLAKAKPAKAQAVAVPREPEARVVSGERIDAEGFAL
jgi:hypothetical protein